MKSKYPDVTIPRVGVTQFVLEKAKERGDKVALIDGVSGQRMTYWELVTHVDHLCAALYARGYRKGDTFLLCTRNCIEYPLIIFAILKFGGIVTTANPMYTAGELETQLKDAQVVCIITDVEAAPKLKQASLGCERVREMLSVGGRAAGCTSVWDVVQHGRSLPPAPHVHIDVINDVAVLPYSSGTTGSPKGVMLTHHNLVANVCQILNPDFMSPDVLSGDSVSLAVLPLFHIYGLVVIQLVTLITGATMVTLPSFDLETFLQSVQKYRATMLFLVPPLILLLGKNPLVDQYDLTCVRHIFSGAAPLGKDQTIEIMKRLNIDDVRQGYGMTETGPVTHFSPIRGWKHGCVGNIVANTECKVMDVESGKELGVNEDGEVCVRGPQIMKGYFGNQQATAATIDSNGWLHTGDIGHYDEDGQFYIVDRLKELIKYKGFQVAPADLESLILTHPAVSDVAVIGLPHLEAGELPRAFVVVKPGQSATEHDIVTFVAERVSPHKRLRGGVDFVKEIPKSASGKILRRVLRASLTQTKSKL